MGSRGDRTEGVVSSWKAQARGSNAQTSQEKTDHLLGGGFFCLTLLFASLGIRPAVGQMVVEGMALLDECRRCCYCGKP